MQASEEMIMGKKNRNCQYWWLCCVWSIWKSLES